MKPIEKIIRSVFGKHQEELRPVKPKIIPFQGTFWGNTANHNSLGDFYELITCAFYGGKLTNIRYIISKNNGNPEKGIYDGYMKPDVVHKKERVIGESKACVLGQSCNLLDAQIERYKEIQLQDNERIYFAFYRHSVRKIKSYEGTEEELFQELCKKTNYSIVLPLSTVLRLYEAGRSHSQNALVYRYEQEQNEKYTYPGCTCMRSPTLNKLLVDPEEILRTLGLNQAEYTILRRTSPLRFLVNGIPLRTFPIVEIRDKDPEIWKEKFRGAYDPARDGCSDVKERETTLERRVSSVPF